jgi:hypothetical protein
MDAEFICREIDDRKGEGLAIGYELHTIQIFGSISKTTWASSAPLAATYSFFPSLKLPIDCNYAVEGWLILRQGPHNLP